MSFFTRYSPIVQELQLGLQEPRFYGIHSHFGQQSHQNQGLHNHSQSQQEIQNLYRVHQQLDHADFAAHQEQSNLVNPVISSQLLSHVETARELVHHNVQQIKQRSYQASSSLDQEDQQPLKVYKRFNEFSSKREKDQQLLEDYKKLYEVKDKIRNLVQERVYSQDLVHKEQIALKVRQLVNTAKDLTKSLIQQQKALQDQEAQEAQQAQQEQQNQINFGQQENFSQQSSAFEFSGQQPSFLGHQGQFSQQPSFQNHQSIYGQSPFQGQQSQLSPQGFFAQYSPVFRSPELEWAL